MQYSRAEQNWGNRREEDLTKSFEISCYFDDMCVNYNGKSEIDLEGKCIVGFYYKRIGYIIEI